MTGWGSRFDFAVFQRAFEDKDFESQVSFYADDAEWTEYRYLSPPRSPNRMVGKRQITGFLRQICPSYLGVNKADEVIGQERITFSVDRALPDGRQVLEHLIGHLEDGQVVRKVDVEAWDD
jgi:hypothetical protein